MPNNSPPHSQDLEREKLELDRWVKSAELQLRERELHMKAQADQRAFWKSPLVITVVAALIGYLTNAWIAQENAVEQRTLEQMKMQADVIIRASENHDSSDLVKNLNLLLKMKLVEDTNGELKKFIDETVRLAGYRYRGNASKDVSPEERRIERGIGVLTSVYGACTAFLVAEGLVMTSSQCPTIMVRDQEAATSLRMRFLGDNNGQRYFDGISVIPAAIEIDNDLGYAVFRLSTPSTGVEPIRLSGDPPFIGQQEMTVQVDTFGGKVIVDGQNCHVTGIQNSEIVHGCILEGWISGCPVLWGGRLIGIITQTVDGDGKWQTRTVRADRILAHTHAIQQDTPSLDPGPR